MNKKSNWVGTTLITISLLFFSIETSFSRKSDNVFTDEIPALMHLFICEGNSITLTAPPGHTYLWSNNATTQTINVSPIVTTSYYYILLDIDQNTLHNLNVVVYPKPSLAIAGNTSICANFPTTLSATTLNSGAPIQSYKWSTGEANKVIVVNPAINTKYTVEVTDFYQCKNSAEINITVNPSVIQSGIVNDVSCTGAANGSITLPLISGTPPYSFDWTDLNNNNEPKDRTNLMPGNYSVVVTDSKGCNSTGYYSIKESSPLDVSGSTNSAKCGENSGSIILSVVDGSFPYNFDWADIVGTNNSKDRTNLGAGTYSIIITDSKGCTVNKSFTISQLGGPVIDHYLTNTSCAGANTGAINLTISGGLAPYTFYWADLGGSAGPEDRINLPNGPYTVTVKDANNCSKTYSTYISTEQYTYPLFTSILSKNVTCHGANNGSISLTQLDPQQVYLYDWADIPGTNNPRDRANLASGNYSVIAQNSIGCTSSFSFTISQPSMALFVTGQVNHTSCGESNGSIVLNISGGSQPYRIDWQDISGVNDIKDRTGLASNLLTFPYVVKIYDANGCEATASFNINHSIYPQIINDTVTHNQCFNQAVGGIKFSILGTIPLGVTKPFIYDWEDITGRDNIKDRTNLKAGTYSIIVTDYFGCTAKKIFLLTQPDSALLITSSLTNTSCSTPSGSITLVVKGGKSPYNFDWSDLSGANNPQQRTNLPSASYNVNVTDILGCSKLLNFNISNPFAPQITAQLTQLTCSGSSNGAIVINATSGVLPYTYDWLDIGGASNPKDRSNLVAGTYELKITDGAGCIIQYQYKINLIDPITVSTSITHQVIDNFKGEINITVSGGTASYKYDWADITGLDNPADRLNLDPGTYQVVISDKNNCTSSQSYTINSIASPIIVTPQIKNNTCFGDTSGQIQLTISGGTAPYTFDWNDLSGSSDARDRFKLTNGSYSVEILDDAGNRKKSVISIQSPPQISITPEVKDSNTVSWGSILLVVNGGVPPYYFKWQDSVNSSITKYRDSLRPGRYGIKITDQNGCSIDTAYYINQSLLNKINLDYYIDHIACAGNKSGKINIFTFGGVAPYTYDWSDLSGTNDIASRDSLVIGIYHVIIKDANGQAIGQSFEVKEAKPLDITYAIIYTGFNNIFDIAITATGGSKPYYFDWQDINGPLNLANRTVPRGGNYYLTVSDSLGCAVKKEITVLNNWAMNVTPTYIPPSCIGGSNGSISFKFSFIPPPSRPLIYYSFNGEPEVVTSNTSLTVTKSNLKASTYKLFIRPTLGWDYEQTTFYFTLPEPTPVKITETHNRINCKSPLAGYINLDVKGGAAPYTYAWSDGPTTQHRTQVKAGTYKVKVTDAKGCKDSLSITTYSYSVNGQIIEKDTCQPYFYLAGPDTTLSIDEKTPCHFIGVDIGPEYCYSWEPSALFQDSHSPIQYVCPEPGQNYSLYISTPENIIRILNYSFCGVKVDLIDTMPTICAPNTKIILDVKQDFVKYKWLSPTGVVLSSTKDTLTVTKSGRYTLQVEDEIGCKVNKEIVVKEKCGLVCTDIVIQLAPDDAYIRQRIGDITIGLGTSIKFYLTHNDGTALAGQSGSRRIQAWDQLINVKNLFAAQNFPEKIGIWLHWDDGTNGTKKLCYAFRFNKNYESLLRSKFDESSGSFDELLTYLDKLSLSFYDKRNEGLSGDLSAALGEAGALALGSISKTIETRKIPCSLYDDCICWKWYTPFTNKLLNPVLAGIIDEVIKEGVDILNAVKTITLSTAKLIFDPEAQAKLWNDIKQLAGEFKESLPASLSDLGKYATQLGQFLAVSFDNLSAELSQKFIKIQKSASLDRCQAIPGQYALGEIIAKVGLLIVPASKANALKGSQVILSKFFKILPSMNRWGPLPYLKQLLKDIQQKGDEFFNYVKGLIKPRGYDALQKYPALRTDVELLRKLDKHLEGKSDDEIRKIKELLDKESDDLSRRKKINNIIDGLKFTKEQIEYYVKIATKNDGNAKVMLGKFDGGISNPNSYLSRARTDHTFFDLGNSNWNEAKSLVNGNNDEMWEINKAFLDIQKAKNKEFYLSHDPNFADGFYKREVDYLTGSPINGQIIKVNNSLWKIIF